MHSKKRLKIMIFPKIILNKKEPYRLKYKL